MGDVISNIPTKNVCFIFLPYSVAGMQKCNILLWTEFITIIYFILFISEWVTAQSIQITRIGIYMYIV